MGRDESPLALLRWGRRKVRTSSGQTDRQTGRPARRRSWTTVTLYWLREMFARFCIHIYRLFRAATTTPPRLFHSHPDYVVLLPEIDRLIIFPLLSLEPIPLAWAKTTTTGNVVWHRAQESVRLVTCVSANSRLPVIKYTIQMYAPVDLDRQTLIAHSCRLFPHQSPQKAH